MTESYHQVLKRYYAQGDFKALRRECERLLAESPQDGVIHEFLAHCDVIDGNIQSAITHFETALIDSPISAGILANLGALLLKCGRNEDALAYLQQAKTYAADNMNYIYMLGEAYRNLRRFQDAVVCYENILAKNPHHDLSQLALARLYIDNYDIEAATAILDNSPSLDRNSVTYIGLQVEIERTLGHWESSRKLLKKALATRAEAGGLPTLYLYTLNFSEAICRDEIFQEHRRIGQTYFSPLVQKNRRNTPNRDTLRIGFVSPDFRVHSVAYFAEAIYSHIDRDRVSLLSYYNHVSNDEYTQLFREKSDKWTVVEPLSAQNAATVIENDGLDILIDLAGHTHGSRLDIFRYEPAPRLVTYLGYPNTTGLPSMDYRITDAFADPPGDGERLNTESLVRLPNSFLCYTPPVEIPVVDRAPCFTRGFVTFGCFNVDLKINATILQLWKRILVAVPRSRLAIKTRTNTTVNAKRLLEKRCQDAGLDTSRVDILPAAADTAAHLGVYNFIDIALDTFPYQGTTTTCEALWMGVPVVSLQGDRHAARVGASILTNIGLLEFMASTPDDYVELAVGLALDAQRIEGYRHHIRNMMLRSPLMNAQLFAKHFLQACEYIVNTAPSHQ